MKKIISIFMTVVMLIGIFVIPASAAKEVRGNTTSNTVNRGEVAVYGDYVYYLYENALYRTTKDGKNTVCLKRDFAHYGLFATDNYIYGYQEGYGINPYKKYSIKDKTVENITFKAQKGWEYPDEIVAINDGYIYYVFNSRLENNSINENSRDSYICRDRLDNKGRPSVKNVAVIDKAVASDNRYAYYDFVTVSNGYVYSRSLDEILYQDTYDIKFNKVKVDGKSKKNISFDLGDITYTDFRRAVLSDGWIYFVGSVKKNDKWNISVYKVDLNGKNLKKVKALITSASYNNSVYGFTVDSGWIYYYTNDKGLYKLKTDGTGNTRVHKPTDSYYENQKKYIWIAGEWIYEYENYSYLVKTKTNGKSKTTINAIYEENADTHAG